MGIEKQIVSCRLDSDMIEKLRKLAENENRSLSNMIETILKSYFGEQEKNPLEFN